VRPISIPDKAAPARHDIATGIEVSGIKIINDILKGAQLKIDTKTKVLAAFCKVCPFCIAARHCPNSAYAKKLKEIEKNCPFCKAYSKLKAYNSNTSRPQ
jgi:hypothetical protein